MTKSFTNLTIKISLVLIFFVFLAMGAPLTFKVETTDGYPIFTQFMGTSPDKPLIIFIHMLSGDHRSWAKILPYFHKQGFNVVSFDLRGHGQSTKNGETWRSFKKEDYLKTLDDIQTIKNTLKEKKLIKGDKIFLVGASIGATFALKYALNDPDVKSLVLLSPGLAYKDINISEEIKNIKKTSIFFIVGTGDKYSFESTQKLIAQHKNFSSASQTQLKVLNSEDHGTMLFHSFQELKDIILTWFQRY